jgi:oxygen-dependent protoporphyrinogen oxidase
MSPETSPRRPAERRPTVAVVGGGIAGLAAAWELSGGAGGPGPETPHVVLLEADGRLGGKLRTEMFDGRPVDTGPDGFLGRRPEAAQLCREVGLGDRLRPIAASGASVWARGRARALPKDLALGIPTRFWPVARSGILGPGGTLRLWRDAAWPRSNLRGRLGDRAIGPLVARKLGHQVVDRLVDPLIGGIHAGSVSDMSAAAMFPLLLVVSQRRGSFMRALRQATARGGAIGATSAEPRPNRSPGSADGPAGTDGPGPGTDGPRSDPVAVGDGEAAPGPDPGPAEPVVADPAEPPPPMFWTLDGGLESMVDGLADALRGRGVDLRLGTRVELLDRSPEGSPPWVLHTLEGPVVADGLVLATPARAAADLLAPHDSDAATLLRGIDYSSVTVVTLTYPDSALTRALYGTGLIVPHGTPSPPELDTDEPLLVTACTYLSQKWPLLSKPGEVLVRASAGRFGDERPSAMTDEELVGRVTAELTLLTGLVGPPSAWSVTRWPDAFPQYRVHHLLRATAIESAARRHPALAVAGSAYRGVGIPACVASGRAAATLVLEDVIGQPSEAGPRP